MSDDARIKLELEYMEQEKVVSRAQESLRAIGEEVVHRYAQFKEGDRVFIKRPGKEAERGIIEGAKYAPYEPNSLDGIEYRIKRVTVDWKPWGDQHVNLRPGSTLQKFDGEGE